MANDPARMELYDEIQSGMLWIDEYLAQIESSTISVDQPKSVFRWFARREVTLIVCRVPNSLFELVKTPGRNKGTAKKTRAAIQLDQAAEQRLKAINGPLFETEVSRWSRSMYQR